jgi:hypothetical protein
VSVEWTRVRHPDTGGEAIVPVESLPLHEPRGWEPFGEEADDPAVLLIQADTERADAAEAAAAQAEQAAESTEGGTVAEVLAAVGDDPTAARAALDAEQAKDHPRSTLVARLEQIADSDADEAPTTAGGE